MGYYTKYRLEIEPDDKEVIALVRISNENIRWAVDDSGATEERLTWYHWEEDMRKVSSEYPTFTFHLYGEGENNEDIWAATFRDGKAHIRRAEINILPFDEKELE